MKITTLVALVNIAIWISVAVAIIFAIATLHTAKPLWAFLIPAFSMLTFKKEGPEEDISQYDNNGVSDMTERSDDREKNIRNDAE